jgi:hypothetical protein
MARCGDRRTVRGAAELVFWLLTVAAVALALDACGPSPQRLQCLDYCQRNNDACIARATSDPEIAGCGSSTSACVARCPP